MSNTVVETGEVDVETSESIGANGAVEVSKDVMRVFNFDGASVRVVLRDCEPWWVLADLCKVLDIADVKQVAERLDEDEKDLVSTSFVSKNAISSELAEGVLKTSSENTVKNKGWANLITKAYIINEPGLYNVIGASRKPEAKAFKRWITHEVLPSIRKTGFYRVPTLPDRKTLAKMVLEAEEELEAQRAQIRSLETKTDKLEGGIHCAVTKLNAPKFRNQISMIQLIEKSEEGLLDCNTSALVFNFKIDDRPVGQKRLNKIFRNWGLIRQEGTVPLQTTVENGYMKSENVPWEKSNRHGAVTPQIHTKGVFTGRGISYVVKRGIEEGYLPVNTNAEQYVNDIIQTLQNSI